MKKTLFFIALTFLFLGCSSDDDPTHEEILACETQELGIDELSKFSEIVYTPTGDIHHEWSHRWLWKIENDTIEISGSSFRLYETSHFLLKKNEENCVDFLFARDIFFDDNINLDEETGEVISGGYSWNTFYDSEFIIQEYIENERLVCKVDNVTIWMDFTLDIKNEEWQFEPSL